MTTDEIHEVARQSVVGADAAGAPQILRRQPLVPLRGAPSLHLYQPEQLQRLRAATPAILACGPFVRRYRCQEARSRSAFLQSSSFRLKHSAGRPT